MEQRDSNVDKEPSNNHDVRSPTVDGSELTESSYKWPQLRRLIFKYNNVEKIDKSLVRIKC